MVNLISQIIAIGCFWGLLGGIAGCVSSNIPAVYAVTIVGAFASGFWLAKAHN